MSTRIVSLKALMLLVAGLLGAPALFAQYKAPSDYFRKDSPNRPGGPAQPGGAPAAPVAPGNAKPAFKDLPVNTQFYFLTDTNRAYAWTKITDATAKNDKSGQTRAIPAATQVQR